MKWTAIVANTDYDRFDNTESPFTSTNTEQERILIATTCPPCIQDFSYDFDGISLSLEYDATRTFSNMWTILLCISTFYV